MAEINSGSMRVRRTKFALVVALSGLVSLTIASTAHSAPAAKKKSLTCASPSATKSLGEGFALQADGNSEDALKAYKHCLKTEPKCVDCLYEVGWTYWKLGEWKEVIRTWEEALALAPQHPEIPAYLPSAKNNLAAVEKKIFSQDLKRNTDLLITSRPADAPVQMTFIGRWQSYNKNVTNPLDRFDLDIDSPKSVNFSPDGKLAYVNSLEGAKTVVFDSTGTEKKAVIRHRFGANEARFFAATPPFDYSFPKSAKNPNVFTGKPVEGEFTHGGKFFWAPYYRRNWDVLSRYPSAMAVIDTSKHQIARVLHVGPISKYVRSSPDGKILAVSHWGDNTVGLWDISSDDPKQFKELELLTVDERMPQSKMDGDRDKNCGFCVRGLAFSQDSRHLFVGRMSGGGIAVFDLNSKPRKYLGTVMGLAPGPRDLHVGPDGQDLFISCNSTGFIWRVPIASLLTALEKAESKSVTLAKGTEGILSGFAGLGVRSIKLSPAGDFVFAAVNQTSEIVVFRTRDMTIVSRITVDSYPVGLDLSPDGLQLWVTSQGRNSQGGNSVGAFQIRYKNDELILKTKGPTAATTSTTGGETAKTGTK